MLGCTNGWPYCRRVSMGASTKVAYLWKWLYGTRSGSLQSSRQIHTVKTYRWRLPGLFPLHLSFTINVGKRCDKQPTYLWATHLDGPHRSSRSTVILGSRFGSFLTAPFLFRSVRFRVPDVCFLTSAQNS